MTKERTWITGAAGQLATALAAALQKFEAYEILKLPAGTAETYCRVLPPHSKARELDILGNFFGQVLAELRPTLVIHAAALVNTDRCLASPEAAIATNVLGTQRVLAACQAIGAKLVYISTTAAYDPAVGRGGLHPFTEDDPQVPWTIYGATKLAGELIARRQQAVPWLVIRPCFIYGNAQLDKSSTLTRAALNSAQGKSTTVLLDPQNYKDYMRIEDFAAGAVTAMRLGCWGECFNVAGEQPRITAKFYSAMAAALNLPQLLLTWRPETDYLGHHLVSTAKLRCWSKLKLGTAWQPRLSLEEGTKLTATSIQQLLCP